MLFNFDSYEYEKKYEYIYVRNFALILTVKINKNEQVVSYLDLKRKSYSYKDMFVKHVKPMGSDTIVVVIFNETGDLYYKAHKIYKNNKYCMLSRNFYAPTKRFYYTYKEEYEQYRYRSFWDYCVMLCDLIRGKLDTFTNDFEEMDNEKLKKAFCFQLSFLKHTAK